MDFSHDAPVHLEDSDSRRSPVGVSESVPILCLPIQIIVLHRIFSLAFILFPETSPQQRTMLATSLRRAIQTSIRAELSNVPIASRPFSTASPAFTRPTPRPIRLPYFTPCTRSSFFFPSHTFKFPRSLSTAVPKKQVHSDIPKSLPYWLYGCSAVVFGIIVIGGLTRLTESGLSIVEWNPITGILPPITKDDWDAEWEKYKVSPEGIMMNANISRDEFKKIFYMEWGHRLAGRALGIGCVLSKVNIC